MPNKQLTLVLLMDGKRILLGMKKRGFGAGRWNGFGGKVESNEAVEAAAKREVQEEVGITVTELKPVGLLTFSFEGQEQKLDVHLFTVSAWTDELTETEEMRPQWFAYDAIPYAEMWLDDVYWLPQVLAGKTVRGTFDFKDQQTLLRHNVTTT